MLIFVNLIYASEWISQSYDSSHKLPKKPFLGEIERLETFLMPGSFVNESLMLSAMEVMTRVINSNNDSTIHYFGACSN